MGLGIGISSSSYDKPSGMVVNVVCDCGNKMEAKKPKPLPNPDPTNYRLQDWITIGRYLIVQIRYPNCTNYEGKKILVFENTTIEQLSAQKSIDPHFSDNKEYISPIARFEPTLRGWDHAETFCKAMMSLI